MKKTKMLLVCLLLVFGAVSSKLGVLCVYAANSHGAGQGRTDTVNVNDYSTHNWQRFQYNYQFNSGPDAQSTFGVPTQTSRLGSDPLNDNIRRNKDVAYLPPSYGVFSGDIPTNPSSLYHQYDSAANATNATFNGAASVNYYGETTGVLQSTSLMLTPGGTSNISNPSNSGNSGNLIPNAFGTSSVTVNHIPANHTVTQPALFDDGSIGHLSIPAINTFVKVFAGEVMADMRLGAAHLDYTSAWDGNVCIAGHNRGANDYFKGVKDIKIGDLITYETMYGSRTYKVYLKEQISETDFTYLGWSRDNEITLITCVIDQPSLRWAVKASEVR